MRRMCRGRMRCNLPDTGNQPAGVTHGKIASSILRKSRRRRGARRSLRYCIDYKVLGLEQQLVFVIRRNLSKIRCRVLKPTYMWRNQRPKGERMKAPEIPDNICGGTHAGSGAEASRFRPSEHGDPFEEYSFQRRTSEGARRSKESQNSSSEASSTRYQSWHGAIGRTDPTSSLTSDGVITRVFPLKRHTAGDGRAAIHPEDLAMLMQKMGGAPRG